MYTYIYIYIYYVWRYCAACCLAEGRGAARDGRRPRPHHTAWWYDLSLSICIYLSLYLYIYIYIICIYDIWYWCLWKNTCWASPCPATQQQKLLSGAWFGVLQANIPTGLLIQRSVFFHRHRYDMTWYDLTWNDMMHCSGENWKRKKLITTNAV